MNPIDVNRSLTRFARRLSWPLRRAHARRRLPIVMYHGVHPGPAPYAVSPAAFERQIDFIRRQHRVIPLREVPLALRLREDAPSPVVITFDDAYRDFDEHARPLLQRHGLPCTVFVPTGFIGRRNEWDRDVEGAAGLPIMDEAALQRIAASALVEIGSHSVDHVRMSTLEPQAMRQQAELSKQALEKLVGRPVTSFAYPYGQLDDFSQESTQTLAAAGYSLAVTTHWGIIQSERRLLQLRRIHFAEEDDERDLRAKLEGEDDWRAWKERLGFTYRRWTRPELEREVS